MGSKMNKIEPDLHADIIPGISGAGINIGITLKYFLENTDHRLINSKDFNDSLAINKEWLVIEYNFLDIYGVAKTSYSATWDRKNDIILRFDGNNDVILNFMILQENYKGKLLKKWGLGTALKELAEEYDIIFYADTHYIKEKNSDKDEVIPVEIHTDYLLDFEEQANQIVKAMCLYT